MIYGKNITFFSGFCVVSICNEFDAVCDRWITLVLLSDTVFMAFLVVLSISLHYEKIVQNLDLLQDLHIYISYNSENCQHLIVAT